MRFVTAILFLLSESNAPFDSNRRQTLIAIVN